MIDERRIGSCAVFAHDIIRLPSEARVDHDHEAVLHDIMNTRESTCLHITFVIGIKHDFQ